jgi:hypothetical protein
VSLVRSAPQNRVLIWSGRQPSPLTRRSTIFYTAVHTRRQFWTSYSPSWELEISHYWSCWTSSSFSFWDKVAHYTDMDMKLRHTEIVSHICIVIQQNKAAVLMDRISMDAQHIDCADWNSTMSCCCRYSVDGRRLVQLGSAEAV